MEAYGIDWDGPLSEQPCNNWVDVLETYSLPSDHKFQRLPMLVNPLLLSDCRGIDLTWTPEHFVVLVMLAMLFSVYDVLHEVLPKWKCAYQKHQGFFYAMQALSKCQHLLREHTSCHKGFLIICLIPFHWHLGCHCLFATYGPLQTRRRSHLHATWWSGFVWSPYNALHEMLVKPLCCFFSWIKQTLEGAVP